MAKATIPDYPRGLTFEDVWAGLMENRQQMKETDRRLKEAERLIIENAKQHKETERLSRENSRQIGGLHRSFGELAEHLVAPGIIKHLNKRGYIFKEGALHSGLQIFEKGNIKIEVDLLLENDDFMIAVEVKSKPVEKDIEHHVRRLEILREHSSKHHDTRKIHGAIAGAVFTQTVKKLTVKAGLYVLEQSGDTMKIAVPEGFVPREW